MQPTKQMNATEKLVAIIKSRIFEIRASLKKCTDPIETAVLEDALTNNCTWLLSMGHSPSEVVEV